MAVSIDTRTIAPGDVFIPLKGPNFDGHDFIEEALRKGARKKLHVKDIGQYAARYRKKLGCKVIAVTGSAGKTTVKDMLASTLSQKFNVHKSHENQNNEIGVPLTVLNADSSTDIIVMELAMRNKGDISALTRIARPTHVVVTGIGYTHIEFLNSLRNVAKAKAEIFRAPLKWENQDRIAYINYDSPFYNFLEKKASQSRYRVFPYKGPDKPDQNLNLCYMLAKQFGLSDPEIEKGLLAYKGSSHRMDIQKVKDITVIDDTYNANPDGVAYALQYLKRFSGRKILVLADMLELGEFSKSAHQNLIEQVLDAGVEMVFAFGDEMAKIRTDKVPIYHHNTKKSLHDQLLVELKSGDVVLAKGSRGMKMEETIEAIHDYYR